MRKTNVVLLFSLTLFSCHYTSKTDLELKQILGKFTKYISAKNMDSLRVITTQKGFDSLLLLSDSLQSDFFINGLSTCLQNPSTHIFAVKDYDSLIYLSLGEPDDIIGATSAYLVLRRIDGQIKIERLINPNLIINIKTSLAIFKYYFLFNLH